MSSHPVLFPTLVVVAAFYVLAWMLVATCVVSFLLLRGAFGVMGRLLR